MSAAEHLDLDGLARPLGVVLSAAPELPGPTPDPLAPVMSRGKRVVDVVVAAGALLALLPLLATIAAAVALTSRGPILFRQVRIGVAGRPFTMWKFRSMVHDAEERRAELSHRNEASGPLFKIHDDPRVTTLGRLLRRTSLDELPQLVNVLTGSMSLVGPRPALPDEAACLGPSERARETVRPGLTGLAQVSGRSDLDWARAVALDLRYVREMSWRLDLQILLSTMPAVLARRGAY